jgi:hypothetical protein
MEAGTIVLISLDRETCCLRECVVDRRCNRYAVLVPGDCVALEVGKSAFPLALDHGRRRAGAGFLKQISGGHRRRGLGPPKEQNTQIDGRVIDHPGPKAARNQQNRGEYEAEYCC